MNRISLSDDRILSCVAKAVIIIYVALGFFEKIHAIVDTILVLDGFATALGAAFIILWFDCRRNFSCNGGSVSLVVFTFFILFSSLVGASSLERLSVSLFALIETWALILAFAEVKRDIHDVFLYLSIFAIAFCFVYSVFGLVKGIENDELRFSGLSEQSNSLGVMASMAAILCMMNIRKWKRIDATIVWNLFISALIPFFLYVLLVSDSRTSQFAVVFSCLTIVILALVFLNKRTVAYWSFIPALLVILVSVVFIVSGDRSAKSYTLDSLSSGRTVIWRETFGAMELKEYVMGFSGNNGKMQEALKENNASPVTLINQGERNLAHNMFLGMLFEYGIVVALSFIYAWLWSMKKGIVYLMNDKRWALREVFASLSLLSFFFIHSLSESSIYFIGGAEQLLFLSSLAMIYGVTTVKRRSVNE